jgi:hypothetical protein
LLAEGLQASAAHEVALDRLIPMPTAESRGEEEIFGKGPKSEAVTGTRGVHSSQEQN